MFDEPVLLGTARLRMGRQNMRVKTYGERAGRSGETDKIPAEVGLCKRIAQTLFAHYPGHPWAVEVNIEQGIAFITIPPLLGNNWGYILHLDKIVNESDFAGSVKEAGGNLLERFNIPGSDININAYIEAERKHPLLGNFRPVRTHGALIPS